MCVLRGVIFEHRLTFNVGLIFCFFVSGVIWEYKKESKKRYKQLSLHDTALIEALYQEYMLECVVHEATDKCYLLEGKHQVRNEVIEKKYMLLLLLLLFIVDNV